MHLAAVSGWTFNILVDSGFDFLTQIWYLLTVHPLATKQKIKIIRILNCCNCVSDSGRLWFSTHFEPDKKICVEPYDIQWTRVVTKSVTKLSQIRHTHLVLLILPLHSPNLILNSRILFFHLNQSRSPQDSTQVLKIWLKIVTYHKWDHILRLYDSKNFWLTSSFKIWSLNVRWKYKYMFLPVFCRICNFPNINVIWLVWDILLR